MEGVLGDVIVVNGAAWPTLEVTNTRYRFRILNASNARRYRLTLDPPPREGPTFVQIGSDVGLLPGPLNLDHVDIAQAERFDVVVDFSSYPIGTQITLTNQFGDGPTSKVMRIHVTGKATDDSTVPARLVEFEPLTRGSATTHPTFHLRPATQWLGHQRTDVRSEPRRRRAATRVYRDLAPRHRRASPRPPASRALPGVDPGAAGNPGRSTPAGRTRSTCAARPRSSRGSPDTAAATSSIATTWSMKTWP